MDLKEVYLKDLAIEMINLANLLNAIRYKLSLINVPKELKDKEEYLTSMIEIYTITEGVTRGFLKEILKDVDINVEIADVQEEDVDYV